MVRCCVVRRCVVGCWVRRTELHFRSLNLCRRGWRPQEPQRTAGSGSLGGSAKAGSASPYRRLSYTWHSFTPEWAAAYGVSDEHLAKVASERRSKVTFDIETVGEMVKLTVIHDDFDAGSAVLRGISEGWPRILSDLKTLLETGDALPVG